MVASGLCHSDVHYNVGDQLTAMPVCGGHEGAGIIEEVGPGVAGLRPGDHVVTSFIPSCGHCRFCASGRQNLCQAGARLQAGPQLDGSYRMHYEGQGISQFMLVSTFSAWSTVQEFGDQDSRRRPSRRCAYSAAGLVPASVLRSTPPTCARGHGDRDGGRGHRYQRSPGRSPDGRRLGDCGRPGALQTGDGGQARRNTRFAHIDEAAEFARSITDGQGADNEIVTIDVVTGDPSPKPFDTIGKGGTVVVTGMASVKDPPGIPISVLVLAGYQKRIQGCLYGMGSPAVDVLREVALYHAGHLKLDELITARLRH